MAQRTVKTFNVNKTSWIGLVVSLAVVTCAVFAPLLATHDPIDQNISKSLRGPSAEFLLGTDYYGRDILSRLLHGARISLTISLSAILIAVLLGSFIGILAGYYGGTFDIIVMQAMDVLLAFPSLILGLILVAMLGPSITNLVLAIAVTAIPQFARIARAPTIAAKERDYIEAARSFGFSNGRIIGLHILPNVLPEILVMGSLWLATAVRVETSLAFIGLGVKPPTATWGGMIREGFENILVSPWLALWPGIAILIVVFSLNLLGDGLRDAIDPKLRGES
ncbi:MAG: ABC transporter permease [Thermodesulfobacteriota bacterium]